MDDDPVAVVLHDELEPRDEFEEGVDQLNCWPFVDEMWTGKGPAGRKGHA